MPDEETSLAPQTSPVPEIPPVAEEFRAAPRYWVLAILGLGATILLLIDLLRGVRWDSLLFALVGLVGGLWALWMATTRVYVVEDGLIVKRFTAAYKLDYQQIVGADVQGRFLSVLSILFHPRLDNGLIDTDQVGSMLIPALVDQAQLIEHVERRIPA